MLLMMLASNIAGNASSTTTPTAVASSPYDFTKNCFSALTSTYGFLGTDDNLPKNTALMMCPLTTNSCCSIRDQQQMYANFISGGEKAKIELHFNQTKILYTTLMNQLQDVQQHATRVRNIITKKRSNCKFLAERIINYQIDTVQSKILANLEKQRTFLIKSYSGFYCDVCNFDSHRNFDFIHREITISQQFCRRVVQNTLPNLLLIKVDMSKLLNLVTTFLNYCDFKGEYNSANSFPLPLNITINATAAQSLNDCRDNRNKKNWLTYCQDVCQQYSFVKFPRFYEGDVRFMNIYSQYLDASLGEIALERSMHPLFDQVGAGARAGPGRKLADSSSSSSSSSSSNSTAKLTKDEVLALLTNPPTPPPADDANGIYTVSAVASPVDLSTYKVVVSTTDGGLEPDIVGDMVNISEASFGAVQRIINNLDAIANNSKSSRKLVQDGSSGMKKSRNLGLVDDGEAPAKPTKRGRNLSERKGAGLKKGHSSHRPKSSAGVLKALGAGLGLFTAAFLGGL